MTPTPTPDLAAIADKCLKIVQLNYPHTDEVIKLFLVDRLTSELAPTLDALAKLEAERVVGTSCNAAVVRNLSEQLTQAEAANAVLLKERDEARANQLHESMRMDPHVYGKMRIAELENELTRLRAFVAEVREHSRRKDKALPTVAEVIDYRAAQHDRLTTLRQAGERLAECVEHCRDATDALAAWRAASKEQP